jgi:hypothetical protein
MEQKSYSVGNSFATIRRGSPLGGTVFVIFKLPPAAITIPGYEINLRHCHDSFNHMETSFKNSLIIHEENTKKNHKRVVSLYRKPPTISPGLIYFRKQFLMSLYKGGGGSMYRGLIYSGAYIQRGLYMDNRLCL